MSLTGKFAFRLSLRGKLILKVEEDVKMRWPIPRTRGFRRRWRDARLLDLAEAELRSLMDLRNRPQLIAENAGVAAFVGALRLDEERILLSDNMAQTDGGKVRQIP
jgi:hypothetical protein